MTEITTEVFIEIITEIMTEIPEIIIEIITEIMCDVIGCLVKFENGCEGLESFYFLKILPTQMMSDLSSRNVLIPAQFNVKPASFKSHIFTETSMNLLKLSMRVRHFLPLHHNQNSNKSRPEVVCWSHSGPPL